MSETQFTAYRDFFGGLAGVSDDTLRQYVNIAKQRVIDDGVQSTNDNYITLVKYALGAMLVKTPAINAESSLTNDIKREKVADVEIEYQASNQSGSIKNTPGGGYEHEYLRLLRGIIGFNHRVAI